MAIAGALAAVGCGGDGDGEGDGGSGAGPGPGPSSPVESGVPGSKAVEQLSADEARQLCAAVGAYVSARFTPDVRKAFSCNLQAAFDAPSDAECPAKVDECLAQGPAGGADGLLPGPGSSAADCEADLATRSGCAATVAELEACFVANLDISMAAFQGATCESVRAGAQGGGEFGAPAARPEACKPVEQKCPQLLADEAEGG